MIASCALFVARDFSNVNMARVNFELFACDI